MASNKVVDFIIIGAGLAGICAFVEIQQAYPQATIKVFEKSHEIGGTWSKNVYPNLSCDIPSQLYSFSFALNPDWSTTYATQGEILAYIQRVAREFGVYDHTNFRQECVSAVWLDDRWLWQLKFKDPDTQKICTQECRFLITATGFCDTPVGVNDIESSEKFLGAIFHTSGWDQSYSFQGKNVLVMGNGSSANQVIPWLLTKGQVNSLLQVVRSEHWIAPKIDTPIGTTQRWVLHNVPFANRAWRLLTALKLDLLFSLFKKGRVGDLLRKPVQSSIQDYMERTAPRKYHSILIPDFPIGAKRIVMDHGYLKSLNDPRVSLLKSRDLRAVGPKTLEIDHETRFEADTIILANGFKTQELLTPVAIHGLQGAILPGIWHQAGNWAAAVMVPNFPNMSILTGPNTLPSGHSTLVEIECTVRYISRLLQPLLAPTQTQSTKCKIQVKQNAYDEYNKWVQTELSGLVYTPKVGNWYIDRKTGKNTLIWPGSQFRFWWSMCITPIK
ncbi:hypothetical protein TWF106_010683 [Orbilia oligospora]|uniref:Uncharacterized protein n=1 Tax=Orbilia oligospora TaxID=2813651 RepID=A0A7C8UME0_ORBOL|nr:hypothetical protein TWF106_010683 [Orbilia oligospora]